MVLDLSFDELEDLPLAGCHAFSGHVSIVQAFDARVKHLFVEQMFGFGVDTNKRSYTIFIEQTFATYFRNSVKYTESPVLHPLFTV